MKKFLLTALIAVALMSSSFASDTHVNRFIKNNFEAEFGHIKDVEWSSISNFAAAKFKHNNRKVQAFYDVSGNLVGTATSISIDELPVYSKRIVAKKYAGYTVKEVIEFQKPEESAYFISVDNGTKSMILMVADGQVSVYK